MRGAVRVGTHAQNAFTLALYSWGEPASCVGMELHLPQGKGIGGGKEHAKTQGKCMVLQDVIGTGVPYDVGVQGTGTSVI